MSEYADFVRLLDALEPWLTDVVIVGGWAHRLYRLHDGAQQLEYKPLMTFDTDVAVPKKLPAQQETIGDRLSQKGFKENFLGEHRPPVTQYRLGSEEGGFYAEFLTPLEGSGYTRDGKVDATARIAGVNSQKLRFLEVLLNDPWKVVLRPSTEMPMVREIAVHIANATAFIVQKLLISAKRDKAHAAKDVLYIHDTMELFGSNLDNLADIWRSSVRPALHANHVDLAKSSGSALFSTINDTLRDASRIAQSAGRLVSPEEMQAVCKAGLGLIFAEP